MTLEIKKSIFIGVAIAGLVVQGCGGGGGGGGATPAGATNTTSSATATNFSSSAASSGSAISASSSSAANSSAMSTSSSSTAGRAEGIYEGTLAGNSNTHFQVAILENDEVWALYGSQTASTFLVNGFIQGQGSSANGQFAATTIRDFGFSPSQPATINARYSTAAMTIAGTLTSYNGAVSFTGGPVSGTSYNYNTAALLSSVAGSWSLSSNTGESVSAYVSSSGAFSASSSLGCSLAGTLAPRASKKNIFNATLTFSSTSNCALPGQTLTGVAIAYPLSTGKTQLVVLAKTSDRYYGFSAFGER